MTTNPSFSFFVFLINNTHCQEKCHRFCDLSPRVYEQSYCSWYKTTGIIKPSFYVMVAILANKNLFSLHRFFSAKFIKFHNTAVLMSSTRWHHNPSWPSLSILNQPFYLTIFFKAIEDYLCQKNMIVGCVSLQWINKNIKKQQWNKWHKSWIFITLCITFPIYLLIFNNTTDMPYLNIMLLTKRIYYSTQKKYQQRATTWINLKLCYNAISKTTAIPAVKRLVTTIRRFRNTVTKFRRNRCTSWIKNNT